MPRVNARLKALRTGAVPAISMRGMAERLGLTHQGYAHYESESGFKQPFLPVPLARQIAAVLQDHNVNPDDVLALAGFDEGQGDAASLSAGEVAWVEVYRQLAPYQRKMLLQFATEMLAPGANDEERRVHSPARQYRPQGADHRG